MREIPETWLAITFAAIITNIVIGVMEHIYHFAWYWSFVGTAVCIVVLIAICKIFRLLSMWMGIALVRRQEGAGMEPKTGKRIVSKGAYEAMKFTGAVFATWLLCCTRIHAAQPHASENRHNTLLIAAVQQGDVARMQRFLRQGASVNARDENHTPVLHIAIGKKNKDAVRLLLSKGADVNGTGRYRRTPLMQAAFYRSNTIARLLISCKALVNAKDEVGTTALMYAARCQNAEGMALLLSKGANPNVTDIAGDTPLLEAAGWVQKQGESSETTCFELLLTHGAILDCSPKDTLTPLLLAANSGNYGLVELLLQKGCAIDERRLSDTPLMAAVKAGRPKTVQLLLSRGAKINLQDEDGKTALMLAVTNHEAALRRTLVATLLEQHPDVNLKTSKGRTAMDFAKQYGDEGIIKKLKQAGTNEL